MISYKISIDGGATWTTQWLTTEEADALKEAGCILMDIREKVLLSKKELLNLLRGGAILGTLLKFEPGQECIIFKSDKFIEGDRIIYIPDLDLNEIPVDRPVRDGEELKDVLGNCYTGDDFIKECGGDRKKAERLFWYCDWQHPSSAVDEIDDDWEN